MPNTKSAERRMRSSAKKNLRNRSVKSKIKSLEANYENLLKSEDKEGAGRVLRAATSALDKAAKTGIVHGGNADRRKSRLSKRLNKLQ